MAMLTKDQIIEHLKKDRYWEPDPDAPDEVWKLFEDVYDAMKENNELGSAEKDDDEDDNKPSSQDTPDTPSSWKDDDEEDNDWDYA